MRILNLTIDWSDLQLKTYKSCMKDLQYYLEPLYVLLLTNLEKSDKIFALYKACFLPSMHNMMLHPKNTKNLMCPAGSHCKISQVACPADHTSTMCLKQLYLKRFRKLIHLGSTSLTSFSGCYFCIYYFYDTLNKVLYVCMYCQLYDICKSLTKLGKVFNYGAFNNND